MIAELIDMPAWRGATEIAEGRLTAEAWVRALLERVGEREPQVRAWACLDGERALESARGCDSRPQRSLLRGVPFGVKDIIDTVDFPTEYGSSIYRGYRPPADAACVAMLRATRAVPLGKTVTTEFALLTPPETRHPEDPASTPGGSSSGSAAAVDERVGVKSLLSTNMFKTWGDVNDAFHFWAKRATRFLGRQGVQRKPGAPPIPD